MTFLLKIVNIFKVNIRKYCKTVNLNHLQVAKVSFRERACIYHKFFVKFSWKIVKDILVLSTGLQAKTILNLKIFFLTLMSFSGKLIHSTPCLQQYQVTLKLDRQLGVKKKKKKKKIQQKVHFCKLLHLYITLFNFYQNPHTYYYPILYPAMFDFH